MAKEAKTVLMNFRLDPDTHKRLKVWCAENETTIATQLRSMIRECLDGEANVTKRVEQRSIDSEKAKKKESLQSFLDEWR